MKSYIIKTSFWIVSIYILYLLIGICFPYSIFDRSYPIYINQLKFVDDSSSSTELLFIGDSRVVSSINPKEIPNTRNLGLVGSTPIDGYFLLKRFLKHNETKNVFISYAWDRLGLLYYPEVILERGVPIGLYDISEYNEVREVAKSLDPVFYNDLTWSNFLLNKLSTPVFIGKQIKNYEPNNYYTNDSICNVINIQKGHITSIWGVDQDLESSKSFEAKIDSFEMHPIYDYYLVSLLKLCVDNNIKVCFESIPFNKTTYDHLSVSVLKQYKDYLFELQSEVQKAIINDTIFFYSNEYFDDVHHMNVNGANTYTDYIITKYYKNNLSSSPTKTL